MPAKEGIAARASTAVAVAEEPAKPSLAQLIIRQKAQVELALPDHLKQNADAYVRGAITLCKQTPALMKCDPMTIIGGLMIASQLGLELGPLQLAYLIPRGGKASFQVGYRGYIELGYRSGMLRDITAESICEGDKFSFDRATGEIHHDWDLHDERGKAYAYYAIANLKGGGRAFWVGGKSEIEKFRKRSAMPNSPAWRDDYDAMAKKTCIRRLEPFLPKSTALSQAFIMDGAIASGSVATDLDVEMDHDFIDAVEVDEHGAIVETGQTNLREALPDDPATLIADGPQS